MRPVVSVPSPTQSRIFVAFSVAVVRDITNHGDDGFMRVVTMEELEEGIRRNENGESEEK
jgi:hypothetical protein